MRKVHRPELAPEPEFSASLWDEEFHWDEEVTLRGPVASRLPIVAQTPLEEALLKAAPIRPPSP